MSRKALGNLPEEGPRCIKRGGSPQICHLYPSNKDLDVSIRVQFVRQLWWLKQANISPEAFDPELVDLSFRRTYSVYGPTTWVYHPREWEQAIIVGESWVCVLVLLKSFCENLSEEDKDTVKEVLWFLERVLCRDAVKYLDFKIDYPPTKRQKGWDWQESRVQKAYKDCDPGKQPTP